MRLTGTERESVKGLLKPYLQNEDPVILEVLAGNSIFQTYKDKDITSLVGLYLQMFKRVDKMANGRYGSLNTLDLRDIVASFKPEIIGHRRLEMDPGNISRTGFYLVLSYAQEKSRVNKHT